MKPNDAGKRQRVGGVSEPLVTTYRWRSSSFAIREGGRTVGAGQVIEIVK